MNVNDNHFYCIRPAEFHCLHFCPHFYKAFKNNITIESAEIIEDRRYNIPVVDLRFDGWYENSVVCLWAKHTEQRKFFIT